MENKKSGVQALVVTAIIVLVVIAGIAVVLNYVPLNEIFNSQTKIQEKVSKEVTVTDEGIADAVEKLYDATVVVKVSKDGKSISGWGSGFVYKRENNAAYVLTNHHVIDGSKSIDVEMSNGVSTPGTLIGSDEFSDVAVVKIDASSVLAVAEIGDSEKLRVGDTVFAIGTPVSLDYSFTVTRGILSGKNRLVEMKSSSSSSDVYSFFGGNRDQKSTDTWYMKLLQIDASINSGNSGGPLANCNGQVVGITNSKLSSSYSQTSIENIGFAIPIEDALEVAENVENGKDNGGEKPTLGVSMTDVAGAKANNIELPDEVKNGAVVVEVMNDSNASRAGLKAGDVIIKYDNYEITDFKHLKYYLFKSKVGDKVRITYLRDGKEKTTELNLKN
ncbi:MAG: trypsin-like peptidase domain-containing protein [Bacilli bacterium]|nr:trypsin-like peptidase domain-containing protein [Bacilli bacterium]